MYKLCELNETEISAVYDSYMVEDFPDNERKPLSMILEGVREGRYVCYGLFEEDARAEVCLFDAENSDSEGRLFDAENGDSERCLFDAENGDSERCLFDADKVLGYAFLAFSKDVKDEVLLDYLAVRKDLRDRGLGSEILKQLTLTLPGLRSLIVEAEDPDRESDAEELAIRNRRIRFYTGNGLQDLKVTVWLYYVYYRLLEFRKDGSPTDPEALRRSYDRIIRSMMSADRANRMLKLYPDKEPFGE